MARSAIAILALCLLGGIAFVLVDRPWESRLGSKDAATSLRLHLQTDDRFRCSHPSGEPLPTEPDWDYICEDVTHPARNAYFVDVSADRIVQIQPAG